MPPRDAKSFAAFALCRSQQLERVDTELTCEAFDDIHAGGILAALERTDVGAIDACAMREFLLRQPCDLSVMPQVHGQDPAYPHGHDWPRL